MGCQLAGATAVFQESRGFYAMTFSGLQSDGGVQSFVKTRQKHSSKASNNWQKKDTVDK